MAEWSLGLAELGTAVDMSGLNKGIDKAEKTAASGFSKIGDILNGALKVGLIGAAAGFVALGAAIVGGVGDAQESAKLMASTQQTIETMGNAAGRTAQQVSDLASSLSDANGQSLFGDDQIQASENLLLTFGNIKGETFDLATALTVDLAQALGGEPQAQAMALGKALDNPKEGYHALARAGLTFSEEQIKAMTTMQDAGNMAGAQAIMIEALNKQVGGQAAAAAQAAGGMVQFKARMGEAAETAGGALLPILGMVASVANDVIAPAIETAAQAFSDLVGYFSAVAEDGDYLNDFLSNLPASIQPAVQLIGELAAAFGTGSADGGGLVGGLTNALYSLDTISPVFDTIGDSINTLAGLIGDIVSEGGDLGVFADDIREMTGIDLSPLVDATRSLVGGLNAAFSDGGIQGGIQFLIDKLAEISPGFALLKGIVEAALPPIQDIVLSVFGIISGFIEAHGQTMLADVTEVWTAIQSLIGAVLPPIQAIVSAVFGAIATFLHAHGADIQAFLGQTWDQIAAIIKIAVALIQAIVVPIFTFIAGFIRDHGTEIQALLSVAWTAIKAIIDGALTIIKGVLTAALQIIHGDWEGAWNTIKEASARVWEDIKALIGAGIDEIKILFGGAAEWIVKTWNGLVSDMTSIGRNIVQGVIDGVKGAASRLMNTLSDLASDALQSAKDALGISSPSKEFAAIGQFSVLGLLTGFREMWPTLTSEVAAMGESLVGQMGDIAEKVQGVIADAFGATATIDRQVAANLDKLKDVLPQYLNYTTGALKEAETTAGEFLDPAVGAKYFKMRSDQILEYAKLQKDLSEAATQEDKDRINAQMLLINKAQQAEIDAFNTSQGAASNPAQSLIEQIQKLIDSTGLGLIDNPALAELAGWIDKLSAPIASAPRALYDPTAPGPVVGTINITQLPGEDAQALAERVMRVIEQRTGERI